MDNEDGVSSVFVYSEKGLEAIKNSNLTLQKLPKEIVAEAQMKKNASKSPLRTLFMNTIKKESSTMLQIKIILLANDCISLLLRIQRMPLRILKRSKRFLKI